MDLKGGIGFMSLLEKIIKYVVYLTVFAVPIFFLPLTVYPVAYNKQVLLACFVFVLLILWVVRTIINKKLSLNFDKLSLAVLVFIVILGLATIFSVSIGQSFWGQSMEADSLFNFFLFALVFFFASQFLTEKKEVIISVGMVFLSDIVLLILFLLQTWFKIFPWNVSFTPIDSVYALTFLSIGVFGLSLLALPYFKETFSRLPRIFFPTILTFQGLLTLCLLISINSWIPWLGLVFIALMILWLGLGDGSFGLKKIFLPLLLLVISLIFLIAKPTLPKLLEISPEVMPSYKTTLDVGGKTITEGAKIFLLGTGPATFGYQYFLYRPSQINLTDFGSVRFSQGHFQFGTLLTTGGIFGVLAGLGLLAVFFWLGIKKCLDKSQDFSDKSLSCLLLAGGLYFWFFWFLAPANFTLNFILFLFMGLWLAISRQGDFALGQKEINFGSSPFKNFVLILIFVILVVVSFLGLWSLGKRYTAHLINLQGVKVASKNIDESIGLLSRAVRLDAEDLYLRNLADAYLLKVKSLLGNQAIAEKERTTLLGQNIQLAVTAAQIAQNQNPVDSLNWFELGIVYENIIPLTNEAEKNALLSYQEAARLDPQNPQIPFQIARTNVTVAKKLEGELEILRKAEEKERDMAKENEIQKNIDTHLLAAEESLKKSLELKANFGPAKELLEQIGR